MSFVQTKDLLKTIEDYGSRALKGYIKLKSLPLAPEVQSMLERVVIQERLMNFSLTAYMKVAPSRVLNVWFQSPGLRQLKKVVRDVEEAEVTDKQDLVELVMRCEETWTSVYRNLCTSPLNADVREVFCNLYETRQQTCRNFVWQANRD